MYTFMLYIFTILHILEILIYRYLKEDLSINILLYHPSKLQIDFYPFCHLIKFIADFTYTTVAFVDFCRLKLCFVPVYYLYMKKLLK